MNLSEFISVLEENESELNVEEKLQKNLKKKIKKVKQKSVDLEQAREIIQKAALLTQKQLSYKISDIVSKALAIVWDDPYEFVADFVKRRNTTECDLLFEKEGLRRKPLDSCGYGTADIASLSLVVAFLNLTEGARPTILMDEPLRNLDKTKVPLASKMIKMLSEKNNVQFIIVTHNQEMIEYADREFQVKKDRKGHSIVKQIKR